MALEDDAGCRLRLHPRGFPGVSSFAAFAVFDLLFCFFVFGSRLAVLGVFFFRFSSSNSASIPSFLFLFLFRWFSSFSSSFRGFHHPWRISRALIMSKLPIDWTAVALPDESTCRRSPSASPSTL